MIPASANAGMELVCNGRQPQTANNSIYIYCSDRREFVKSLGSAWMNIRSNGIGGTVEDLCWEAYKDAKDMHPSISFKDISDSFLIRCNIGLGYIN